jgi:hypothetical protein
MADDKGRQRRYRVRRVLCRLFHGDSTYEEWEVDVTPRLTTRTMVLQGCGNGHIWRERIDDQDPVPASLVGRREDEGETT